MRPRHRRAAALAAAPALALAALAGAGCGSAAPGSTISAPASSGPAASSPATSAPATTGPVRGSGPVDVLYAGSLVSAMTRQIGPGFGTATGYRFEGFSGDSKSLASQIKGGLRQGDVFISASPAVDATLEGATNGNWVSWYATFATSPLVLGYSPSSRFAADVKSKPWYKVLVEPGVLVGRTDPATDPKGKLTAKALDAAASADGEPALRAVAASSSNVYPENGLVGRLQGGQLDFGFFYAAEARAAGIPFVPLTGQHLKATYTVTVLDRAPHPAGAAAFVSYLVGPGAASILAADGFDRVTPIPVSGTAVPPSLQGLLSGR